MRRFVEPSVWAVAAAAVLVAPLVAMVATAVLGLAALLRPAGRRGAWAALAAVPPVVWVGAALLSAVHALRGAPWGEPLAVGAWALLLIAVAASGGEPRGIAPRGEAPRRMALSVGAATGIALQAIAVAPALGGGRAAGWVGHPNLLAPGVVLVAVLLVLAAPRGARWVRWGVVALVLVAAGVALATGSRGTWLGATLGVAAWAFVWPAAGGRDRVRRVAALALIVAAGTAVGAVRGLGVVDLLRTDVERSVVQGVAVSLAAERPVFGHGGVPWAALAQRVEPALPADVLVHAHSVPLHLAARGGGLAVALLLFVAWPAARAAVRALRRRARADPGAVLALSVAAGVVGVQSLVDMVVQHPTVYVAGWLVLAAARERWRDVSSEPVDGWARR